MHGCVVEALQPCGRGRISRKQVTGELTGSL